MPKSKVADRKFSTWDYTRPDYPEVKRKIKECKDRMQDADSYQMFRDAWLDVKREIEYMVYQEEIIYIRHLCGIDYQYSLEEVDIQNREEPSVYALRDACNGIAAASGYRHGLEQEFGKQIFMYTDQNRAAENPAAPFGSPHHLPPWRAYRPPLLFQTQSENILRFPSGF